MVTIALIGMGGAGLAFIHQLIQSPFKDWELFVIEPQKGSSRDKTWCYWVEHDELTSVKHNFAWNTISVHNDGDRILRNLQKYSYKCVQGSAYYQQVSADMATLPNITIVEDVATDITWDESFQKVQVQTSGSGMVTCDFCFTSARTSQSASEKPSFLQQFAGGWVSFDKPVFSPDTVRLMDFDIQQHPNSVHFAYVLPESPANALIEITAFTPTTLPATHFNDMFITYLDSLADQHGASYTIREPEQGIIPMDINQYPRMLNERTFTLGTVSGMVKPSTGYAFYRMQAQARHYITQLETDSPLTPYADTPGRFRFYDALLLNMLKHDPHATLHVFHTLFKKVPVDTVLDFLKESTSLLREASIFLRLPKTPFLKALWRHVSS